MEVMMNFPDFRPRRLRRTENLRRLVRETFLRREDLIYPLFVVEGSGQTQPISAMPGQSRYSVDQLAAQANEIAELQIPAVILFGIPSKDAKNASGNCSFEEDGIVQRAVREIKRATPELTVITDVCLCEYTDHGHCGIVQDGEVLNDPTLEILARQAVSHAEAGADMVAPSDMMDGRIAVMREYLDDAGFSHTPIMSYAAKYASGYYGPFREAADSAPQFGDRSSYQMDPPNAREALREVELDIAEGADIIMVKPALAYLDIIHQVRTQTNYPIAAYNVSGEYSMIKAAAANGWIDGQRVALETLTAIKRAGADMILTYFAKEVAPLL